MFIRCVVTQTLILKFETIIYLYQDTCNNCPLVTIKSGRENLKPVEIFEVFIFIILSFIRNISIMPRQYIGRVFECLISSNKLLLSWW